MAALCIIKPNALQIYYSDHNTPVGVVIPPEAVADMEVISEEALAAAITKTIKPNGQQGAVSAILVVSDELCFASAVQNGTAEEEAAKQILATTPFVHVAVTTVRLADKRIVVAVNQDLYEIYAKILMTLGIVVVAVIPWAALVASGVSTNGEVDNVTVKRAFDSLSALKNSTYPYAADHSPIPVPVGGQKAAPEARKIPWGWIIFGSVALLYAIIMLVFFVR